MSTGVYSYTCAVLWTFVCKIVTLCVVHNSVGSALLVPTVWAYQSLYAWNG